MIFPELFWATNDLSFLPFKIVIPVLIIVLIYVLNKNSKPLFLIPKTKGSLPILVLATFSMIGICVLFPISFDFYGDAFYIKKTLEGYANIWDPNVTTQIFQPDWLSSKVGLDSFYELIFITKYITGEDGRGSVALLEIIFMGIYAFSWIKLVLKTMPSRAGKTIFLIIGFTAPMLNTYMAHFETYALSYTANIVWFGFLIGFLISPKTWKLILLPFLFLLVLQSHITNWMHFPGLIIAILWYFKDNHILSPLFKKHFNWKGVSYFVFIPTLIVGAFAYFYVFDSHNGPRLYDRIDFDGTVFLPFFTNEKTPLDLYNLFSFNHIWDYLTLSFFWGAGLIFMLILALTKFRKQIEWNHPIVICTGTSFTILFAIFFFLNPLLGLVIDWDLFCTPGISGLVFTMSAFSTLKQKENTDDLSEFVNPIILLGFLGSLFWFSNSNAEITPYKMLSYGKRNFKTYRIGTSTELFETIKYIKGDRSLLELDKVIKELKPFAIKNNDMEFANILLERAKYHAKVKDFLKAKQTLVDAFSYNPLSFNIRFELIKTNFSLNKFDEALQQCIYLIKKNHNKKQKITRMAIHIAIAGKQFQEAANLSLFYNKTWGDNLVIKEIEIRLAKGEAIDKLIDLFQQNK